MKLENWHLAKEAPAFAPLFNDLLVTHRSLALKWTFPAPAQTAVRDLLAGFDLAVVDLPTGLGFVLPQSAWPTFAKRVGERFASDAPLQADLAALQAEQAVWWQAGAFRYNLTTTPLVYGILNVTPDSFYDGGRYAQTDAMIAQIEKMVAAGADIIEPGGQTTKPGGFVEVEPDEEWRRIEPAIKLIKARYPQVAVAVDTYKLPVMERALAAGVDIINDVNGFETAAKRHLLSQYHHVGLVTMHSSRGHEYHNLTAGMVDFFRANLQALQAAGIAAERICLDQGIGYAKVADGYQDFAMMNNVAALNQFQRPIMVAISRKGFGQRLFNLPKDERLGVTLIAEAAMYLAGGRVLRVHDVEATRQLVKLLDTIKQSYWTLPGHGEQQ